MEKSIAIACGFARSSSAVLRASLCVSALLFSSQSMAASSLSGLNDLLGPVGELKTVISDSLLAPVEPEPATQQEAFRLLRQASFGPTPEAIDEVIAVGVSAWIEQQIKLPSAYTSERDNHLSHLQRLEQMAVALEPGADWYSRDADNSVMGLFNGAASSFTDRYQMSVWFENALAGPDQLRQRVAYALSQIMVVSAHQSPLDRQAEALAYYYDILARNALGNFRGLLGEMARSPAMGFYLSHQGNKKADLARNTLPDENFARELMQLFSIGLYLLNSDGSPMTNEGELIPSYSQFDVEELAKVMTGWDMASNTRYGRDNGSFTQSMEFNADQHEFAEKQFLGQVVAAGLQNGDDLDAALDILFKHDNVGPFIGKLLIQRLVTSNPSPAYIARVAAIFNNNGSGVRGDLAAVVKTILLDTEARDSATAEDDNFGKAMEPLLAYTSLYRALDVQPLDGWMIKSESGNQLARDSYYFNIHNQLGQGALRAHHVFNFYDADFSPQDEYYSEADPQRVLPEMQLRNPGNIAALFEALKMTSNVLERRHLEYSYGSVANYVNQRNNTSNWNSAGAVALLDFSPALRVFEVAVEGDSNGDFAQLENTQQDDDGNTGRQRGIQALLNFLEQRLLGGASLPADIRQPLAVYLESDSYFTRGDEVRQALRTTAAAIQYISVSSAYMSQK